MPQYFLHYVCHKDHETKVLHITNEAHLRRELINEINLFQYEDDQDSDIKFVPDPAYLTTTQLMHNAVHWGRIHAGYSHNWFNVVHIIAIDDNGKVTLYGAV